MRAVIQRVREASVTISGELVGAIGRGLVVLVAVGRDDSDDDSAYLVDKTINLRIFPNDEGKFDRSTLDVDAELLLVSQFTLYADTRKGRRPSFVGAARSEEALARFKDVVERFQATGLTVETGRFQEMMDVSLVNEGPVTIWLDSADKAPARR
jgi:D-tyrosyl-tRNA(Tyr) deacylase